MKSSTILLFSLFSLPFSHAAMANTNISENTPTKEWRFTVFLDDKEIGFHNFIVEQNNDEQLVYSTARFDVKFLFFNAYTYEHNNVEQWKGQCLTKINALTNDNGDQFSVDGQVTNYGFSVEAANGESTDINTHQSCVKTFAYWDPSFLQTPQLLNSQTGKLETIKAEYIGEQTLNVSGEQTAAQRYRLKGENLQIDLWYSAENRWLALESLTEDGYTVRYQLR